MADPSDSTESCPAAAAWPRRAVRAAGGLMSGATTRKGFVTLADQGIVSATNFLTAILLGRTVDREEYGLYVLGLTVVFFVTQVQMALISTPFTVYHPRLKEDERTRYAGSSLIQQLGLSALAVLIFGLGGVAVSLGVGPPGLLGVAQALAGVVIFILLREFLRRLNFARLAMTQALLLDVGVSVIQLGGLLLLRQYELLSAGRVYLVMGFACGVMALSWLLSGRRVFALRGARPLADLRRSWSMSKWLLVSVAAFALASHSYPWLVAGFHGTAETGAYGACMRVIFAARDIS